MLPEVLFFFITYRVNKSGQRDRKEGNVHNAPGLQSGTFPCSAFFIEIREQVKEIEQHLIL